MTNDKPIKQINADRDGRGWRYHFMCEKLADFFLRVEGVNKEDCAKVFADLQRARLRMNKTLAAYQATRGNGGD